MIEPRLARRVGAVAMIVLASAALFVVLAADKLEWGHHTRISVYFHHVGSLREGAPFVVGGRRAGKVESIALSPRGAPGPLNGDEGVRCVVALSRDVGAGGEVFVGSRGPLAERYLELAPPAEPRPAFPEGAEVLGRDPPSMDRVLQRTWDNLQTAQAFLAEVRPEYEALRVQIGALSATLASLVPDVPAIATLAIEVGALREEANRTWSALGGQPGVDRALALIDATRAAVQQFRGELAQLADRARSLQTALAAAKGHAGRGVDQIAAQLAVAIDRAQAALAKIDPLLAQVDALTALLARGEGSIGKLMHDPEFPEDAKALGKLMKRHPWEIIARPHD